VGKACCCAHHTFRLGFPNCPAIIIIINYTLAIIPPYTLYSRFFYRKLYTLHQGTEGVQDLGFVFLRLSLEKIYDCFMQKEKV
jgi:hypothetical protein